MPNESLTPEQLAGEQKLAAILADPKHGYHRGDPVGLEDYMDAIRQKLGPAGQAAVAEFDGVSAPASSTTPVSAEAGPGPPTPEPPLTTPETVVDLGAELGYEKEEVTALLQWAAQQPAGQHHSKEERLHGFNPVERDQLDNAFQAGLKRLPLSMQLHLERHGLVYNPRVFRELVGLGMYLQDLDEEITMEAQKNPASARLRELVTARHGRQSVTIF